MKLARAGLGRRRSFDALDEFLDRRSLPDVDDAVGIRHAKIYLVAHLKFVADDLFAIHESAVAAAHVFKYHGAVNVRDLGLLPAHATVPQCEFISGLAADAEWKYGKRHVAPRAIRFNHHKPWTVRHSSLPPRQMRS